MARKANVFPSYLLHKQSGQARVRINGRDVLLGPYGSDASRIEYGKLIAKLAGGVPIDPIADSKRGSLPRKESDDPGPSVGEICLVFLKHAETHYVKNGKRTSEYDCMKSVVRPLNELYGMLPAKDFGPLALKAVRQRFVEAGWVRESCNKGVNRIRHIFKWGSLKTNWWHLATLRNSSRRAIAQGQDGSARQRPQNCRRRCADRNGQETGSYAGSRFDRPATPLWGSFSGELLKLTTSIIDRTGDVWKADISDHKTVHHDQSRTLHFGPQGQLILAKYLSADPDAKLFRITRTAFCRAITRACDKGRD
jgi:hypothetical protein